MHIANQSNQNYDPELVKIADYVFSDIESEVAYDTAFYCLLDSIGCAILALQFPACTKLLGPVVPGTEVPQGARVIGTNYILDPIRAAFNLGTMIRWLDFNDTWLAAEWGHPSDNLGAILPLCDYLTRTRQKDLKVKDLLTAMIKAYEIQGILALENSFNHVGLDHVILVKVASTAVSAWLQGGSKEQVLAALSQAWVDGQSLRTYRHAPNTGSRKSWAAGDAARRALELVWLTLRGEEGYPSALTAPTWGFYDVSFCGKSFCFQREFGSYVIENILFKISFPAEFHAQTAVEAAILLHPKIEHKLDKISKIEIKTHESAMRIINKTGKLNNPADRDHCLQYMIAVGLLFGNLTAEHYENNVANDPRIDHLRNKMQVTEEKSFSIDYLDPKKRSIANAIQIFFEDGTTTDKIIIEYPIGHKRRRQEGIPLLLEKFHHNLARHFSEEQLYKISESIKNKDKLFEYNVPEFVELFIFE